ncbi:MAG: hypothetical protein HZC19_02015 [Candidatus Omnitrophica bacterium]|nr:hypothetical protein [Candidatus Omnitrophota bacterium]
MSLDDLYRFGKLEKHSTTSEEIAGLFDVAKRYLKDASQDSISAELRYIAAYQAALAAGEAFLHCNGYKTPKMSHHYMVWEALRQVLDKSFKEQLALFNDARNKRADAFYDHAGLINETEYKEVFDESKRFVESLRGKIKKDFPSLWKGIR